MWERARQKQRKMPWKRKNLNETKESRKFFRSIKATAATTERQLLWHLWHVSSFIAWFAWCHDLPPPSITAPWPHEAQQTPHIIAPLTTQEPMHISTFSQNYFHRNSSVKFMIDELSFTWASWTQFQKDSKTIDHDLKQERFKITTLHNMRQNEHFYKESVCKLA